MNKSIIIMITLSIALFSGGCASMNDGKRTRTEGAVAGGVLGGAAGAGIGLLTGNPRAAIAYAITGAGIGVHKGYLYGSKVAAKKAAYANNETYLTACIDELQKTRATVDEQNAKTSQRVAAKRQELDQLIAQEGNAKKTRKHALALNREAQREIKNSLARLKGVDTMIADHQGAMSAPQNSAVKKAEWDAELAKLKQTRIAIDTQIAKLKEEETHSAMILASR